VTYNLAVARAFLRQVYVAEGLAPPTSADAFTSVYRTLFERAKNPAYWREIAQSGEWAKVALYGVEAYGIFHIGEISTCKVFMFSTGRSLIELPQLAGDTLLATS
jgi:F-type H+-transporting ATPase subunit g